MTKPSKNVLSPLFGWLIAIGLALVLGFLVHYSVGWKPLLSPWREIAPRNLFLAVYLVFVSYAVRTVRIHRFFAPTTTGRLPKSFRLILLHNLFNNLLPMRSGEASFPLLMKRDFGIPYSRSVSGLLYLRLLDLHFLLLLGTVVLTLERGGAWLILPALLAPLPLAGFFAQRWYSSVGEIEPPPRGRIDEWLRGLPTTPSLFWVTWMWTGVNWTTKLLVFAAVLKTFIPIPYSAAIMGSIAGEVSSVLPFHGIGGAGTYEAGILAGLVPFGVPMEIALKGAVNLHLFVLGASILSAGLGLLIPVKKLDTVHEPESVTG